MELNWSTFLVEIVNFAILVWLLTRFLYRPVLKAIESRRETIAKEMERANALQKDAQEQQRRYESRLADWEREKSALKDAFDHELDTERTRREAETAAELQRMRDRADADARAKEQERLEELRTQAEAAAARFAAETLDRVASPDLESRLIDATLEDLRALPEARRRSISHAFGTRTEAVVTTRYPLDDAHRGAVAAALGACLGATPQLRVTQDQSLVAGIRIDLGTVALEGNLANELAWFAQAHGNGRS